MKEKYQSLTAQQLIRRKRFVLFMAGLSGVIFLTCVVILIIQLFSGDKSNMSQLIPGLILPGIVLPMYNGMKKINLELKSRKT